MLTFAAIADQAYGSSPFTVSATSASTGAVTYTVTSGPATVSGNTVAMTGVGTVMLSASQAATTTYAAATAATSFQVTQNNMPTLIFSVIPTQLASNLPFAVGAHSASTGAVTYSVTSGPASIVGSRLTLTGATGTVILGASQAATVNYAAATASTSFLVVARGSVAGHSFSGIVQANGQPVIGANVALFSTGTGGNGSTSNQLTTNVLTDSGGAFTIPASYSCIAASTSLFVRAYGGQVGSGGTANSALMLVAVLPPCGSITNLTTVTLNELTTVATAEALAQFDVNLGGGFGSTATGALGMTNAMRTAADLVNMATGTSPSAVVPANVTVNIPKLNTLANLLTPCAVTPANCTALFSATGLSSAIGPDTLRAAVAIAQDPGSNVGALYALSTGTAFTPVLTAAPPDWMMFVTISGGGLSEPTGIAVDGSGNVWSADNNEVLSVFAPNGAALYANGITNPGLHESLGLAIDASNDIWVVNIETPGNHDGTLAEFNDAGLALTSGIGYTAGLNYPEGIAADPNGDMWIANFGNSTYALYTSSGTQITTNCNVNGCGSGELGFPVAVAVDSNHYAWFADQAGNFVTRVSLDGTSVTDIPCCGLGPSGIAVDAQNNVWVAAYAGNSIAEVANNGTVISSGYTSGGIDHPRGIAVDGAGTVWVANYGGNSVSELAGATATVPGAGLSPSTGFGTDATLSEPSALAIDASGNVWVSNQALNTLVEFIGVAMPVKTPLVGPPQFP